ncbi:hypothetical protein KDK95_23505 [Actinospica sp. MGRD01-02]|uniref:Uncharacterized protein n=1 Tax=Actinospica acidithermotolerans TaxID=2828514 RepID=A0A941EKK1_9ACTN|nr:hypothetical protein [Actinospica acidithermotolerans]MBR7829294.1 hypothetical protein [Actinospica acidithermotolerans]
MLRTLSRGALAGAAGTTALNAVTYLDMAVRARPSSSTPERTVDALAGRAHVEIPGDGPQRQARLTGLGALNGIALGAGIGVIAAGLRRIGVRPPWWAGSVGVAGLAMAASAVPMARLGVSDPRTWSAADWLSDALPHLAYGFVAHEAISA